MGNDLKQSYTDDGSCVICACFEVTENQIRNYFSDPENSVDGLAVDLGVGTKCTACLLDVDLVLDEHFNTHIDPNVVFKATDKLGKANKESGFREYMDERESGFFVQNGEISTVLSFVNYSELFEASDTLATFDYRLRIFGNDGQMARDLRGTIVHDDAALIRFSEISNCPPEGWFLLSFNAQDEGMYGALRPQFILAGSNFSATVHTQPHWSACTGKSVMLLPDNEGFKSSVSVLNPSSKPAQITISVRDVEGNEGPSYKMDLISLGAEIIDLDKILPRQPAGVPTFVQIASNIPVRKHIINHLSDGSWSIDHFPNFK